MSSPWHSQKIEISIYVNDAGSPSTTDPRPDKPPVVIKVKDTAKRKLEFAQGISKTSPNQRNEISNVRIKHQTSSAGPIRIIETSSSSAGPCSSSAGPCSSSAGPCSSSARPSSSSAGPCSSSARPCSSSAGPCSSSTGPCSSSARPSSSSAGPCSSSAGPCSSSARPSSSSAGPCSSSARPSSSSARPSSSSAGPCSSSAGPCSSSAGPSSSSARPFSSLSFFPRNVKRMASRPEILSAQNYLRVVKQILLDRSSCPQQHSPLIRKRCPGGKRPLSSDEQSDNEDDNSEVKSSSSCEGTSKIKKEPEVFPKQEMDEGADSGSDVEIIGEEWPNKCQVKKEKVHVSSQTQTDD